MARILITGGAGFIGSNAARLFQSLGHEIIILDNLSRAQLLNPKNPIPINYNWLELSKLENVSCIKEDIRNFESLKSIFRTHLPEIIIHTAGQTAVTTSLQDPKTDFEINLAGTFNVLEAARQTDLCPIFIYCSTNKVFGESPNKYALIEHETRYSFADPKFNGFNFETAVDNTCHSPYGVSKLCGDLYMQEYGHTYGFLTGVFRMSCIYGINQFGLEDQGWISHFIISMLNNRDINIYGNGKQVRDVLYIEDLLSAYAAYIDKAKQLGPKVFTMGGGINNSISVIECLNYLRSKIKYSGNLIFHPWRMVDQKIYISDITKVSADLSWSPKVPPYEGIDRLIDWTKKHQEIFVQKSTRAEDSD